MENETFNVGTLFDCDKLDEYDQARTRHPLWSQTVIGCKIIGLLQDMYRFNINYVTQSIDANRTIVGHAVALHPAFDDAIDMYSRSMSLQPELLDYSYPVDAIYKWRFGFILRQPEDSTYLLMLYSKPFTRPLWNCLYTMAILISILFFFLQLWEKRVLGKVQESGITYEMLLVVGSYCQHVPPLHAVLASRRTAYLVFFLFTCVIYNFYTSNLLSHLVNDRTEKMSLESLSKSNYNIDIIEDAKSLVEIHFDTDQGNIEIMKEKLQHTKSVTVANGLRRVKTGKTALLSDYISLYPHLRKIFDTQEVCKLISIDLFANVKKYFITSKNFAYKEQFKIGTLRAKEVGVLKRLIKIYYGFCYDCDPPKHVETQFIQIVTPLSTLLFAYAVATLILICERLHYKYYRLFPYID